MPIYTIRDNVTGRTIRVQGDSPPSEEEAQALFQSSQPEELVAGTEQQMSEQRARNLQRQLGLAEPVAPARQPSVTMGVGGDVAAIQGGIQQSGVPFMKRGIAAFAPTADEKIKYYESEYGPGSVIPISSDNLLIRIPDGAGKFKWVIENPAGLDTGDIAELYSKTGEFTAGAAAALTRLPGVPGLFAQAAVASGLSALAANANGAAQDALFRISQGQPVNPSEIAQRRGLSAALETVTSVPLVYGTERIAAASGLRSAVRESVKKFIGEGEKARKRLAASGVDVKTSAEVADAVRSLEPANLTATDAGLRVADTLTALDRQIQQGSERLITRAAEQGQARALNMIEAGTGAKPISPVDAGNAVVSGVKLNVSRAKETVDRLYDEAYKEISAASQTPYQISLRNTDRLIAEIESNLPRSAKQVSGKPTGLVDRFGKPIVGPESTEYGIVSTFEPLKAELAGLRSMTDATQKLEAVRNVRTMLGEKAFKGRGGIFSNLPEREARMLYDSLSKDIDESVASLTGAGAQKLRDANKAYRQLVEPFETSQLLDKIATGGFESGEQLVDAMASGTVSQWQAIRNNLGPNTYNSLRRAVADRMLGASKTTIGNRDFADLSRLSSAIDAQATRAPEVLDEIFGGRQNWQGLQKIANEFSFIQSRQGLFTRRALPSMDELEEARRVMVEQGFDASNSFLRRALGAAEKRRDSLAQSLVAQTRNGNFKYVSENPEAFFDAFVVSGRHDGRYVEGVMNKMPPEVREQVARAGFQLLFQNARDVSRSVVTGAKGSYDIDKMAKMVLGSEQAQNRVRAVIGDRRFETLKDLMRYELSLEVAAARSSQQGKRLSGLISRLPFPNLFAASAASMAIEKASGSRLLREVGPDAVRLFSDARLLSSQPIKTAAGISLIQRATVNPSYGDYLDMMRDFTPEQQQAIDDYLLLR